MHPGIEAEWLVMKLAAYSRHAHVHGPDHDCTVRADELLKSCKTCYVLVVPEMKLFQALGYKDNRKSCVVTGPMTKPRSRCKDNERISHSESNFLLLYK